MSRRRKKPIPKPASRQLPGPTEHRSLFWVHGVVVLILLLGNLGLYHRTTRLDFLSVDDPDYVQNNPYIESFSADNLKHIFTTPYAANYAPVNLLSYSVDVAVAKGKKASFIHLSSALWHGFVCCMVYALAFTIRGEILFAAGAALLFALHPAHVEAVAWISSRKDLVATAFAVPAMTFYLLWRRGMTESANSRVAADVTGLKPARPATGTREIRASLPRLLQGPAWMYVLSLACFVLASGAKQSVLLIPLVMVAWDFIVERRRTIWMLVDKVPFGLITLFFGWMTWRAQPSTNHAWNIFVPAATELKNLWLLTGFGQYVVYRDAPNPAAVAQWVRIAMITFAFAVWATPLLLQRLRQPIRAALALWILIQMIPPMLLNFIVPITDRYLFLPSVGACILVADVLVATSRWVVARVRGGTAKMLNPVVLAAPALAAMACFWAVKTSSYLDEWVDPRSVWYGAHLKTKNPQVAQFLGEIYHNTGDRMNSFVQFGALPSITNEVPLASAILENKKFVEELRAEWSGKAAWRTNSIAYRDTLWNLAWDQYQDSLANRGELSAPNLFLNRGRLLVSLGKYEQGIAEFKNALLLAENSTYSVVRQETVTHALRSIGVAYWNMRKYQEALVWYLKAQETQHQSGQPWVPTMDQEVEKLRGLAGGR